MRAVVVHRGARDGYQVALGLSEHNLLEALVTDLYWPADRAWARTLDTLLPAKFSYSSRQRWAGESLSGGVRQCWVSGLGSLMLSKTSAAPFSWRRSATRWNDTLLGRTAGRLASRKEAALISYSYYGHSAFSNYSGKQPRILFQLHPHPARVREILARERHLHPECTASLEKEWELALPEQDFNRLVAETKMAEHWIVASSFTKDTLIESGLPSERIHIAPYGTDLERFRPPVVKPENRELQLLFVGTINQRKGIKYLLEAMDRLPPGVKLTVCGRVADNLKLFEQYQGRVEVRPGVSAAELVAAYQRADVFVFPSLAEGFGHVLLEAMACGLPVISTTRTAARDLVRSGREGFVIEPGESAELARHIGWFMEHRDRLPEMGRAARLRAEEFTWPGFRRRVAEIVNGILND